MNRTASTPNELPEQASVKIKGHRLHVTLQGDNGMQMRGSDGNGYIHVNAKPGKVTVEVKDLQVPEEGHHFRHRITFLLSSLGFGSDALQSTPTRIDRPLEGENHDTVIQEIELSRHAILGIFLELDVPPNQPPRIVSNLQLWCRVEQ